MAAPKTRRGEGVSWSPWFGFVPQVWFPPFASPNPPVRAVARFQPETSGKPICDRDDPADVERVVTRLMNTAIDVVDHLDGVELSDHWPPSVAQLVSTG
jgi:hypothetical protein